jgi:uncharacterized protein (TIGR00730 family)
VSPRGGLTICVFCASASGLPEPYHAAARRLGELIAGRGHGLIYGGTSSGLMGEVARAVSGGGGRVTGVVPEALAARELAYDRADELVVTETVRQRKAEMDARADAFLALPGGFGTLEELTEVIALRQLRYHTRPIVVVEVEGYWRPFAEMAAGMVEQGFAPGGAGDLFELADGPEEALAIAEAHQPSRGGPGPDPEPAEAG